MKNPFRKKQDESPPIPSTVFQSHQFEKSSEIISRNANYVLVTNGVLLSIFLVSQGKNLLNGISQTSGLHVATSLGFSFNVTATPFSIGSLYFPILFTLFFGFTLISMISCFGCFNVSLYSRMGKRRSIQELVTREKEALPYDGTSLIALFVAFIALLNFNLAALVGESSPYFATVVYSFTVVSFVALTVAVIFFKLFREFDE